MQLGTKESYTSNDSSRLFHSPLHSRLTEVDSASAEGVKSLAERYVWSRFTYIGIYCIYILSEVLWLKELLQLHKELDLLTQLMTKDFIKIISFGFF